MQRSTISYSRDVTAVVTQLRHLTFRSVTAASKKLVYDPNTFIYTLNAN